MNDKPIQTLQELAQNLRADCYYFASPVSAGDTYRLCLFIPALKKRYDGKIILIAKTSHKAVCEMFVGLEYVLCEDKSVDLCRTNNCLVLDNFVAIPKLGNIYSYYFGTGSLFVNSYFDLDRIRLMLPPDAQIVLPTNLPKIDKSLNVKISKIAPLNKLILLCPEANTYSKLPYIIFKKQCQTLCAQGYSVIVNSIKYRQEYAKFFINGVYDLDLSLKEAIALGISCAGVISTRSGFCDIVAPHCKKLKIYYTNFREEIGWDSVLLPNAERAYIYDEPIYKSYMRRYTKSLPLKLYKRYATKGFLRKLRLPFTAYFKIYRRHKGNDIAPNAKEMQELIEQELMQSYEYNLGLALQKACERFWWGGFLFFPFAYLKIRKEKGKKLSRIDIFL